jgi:hypothetical protein
LVDAGFELLHFEDSSEDPRMSREYGRFRPGF